MAIFDTSELEKAFGDWGNWLTTHLLEIDYAPVIPDIEEVCLNSISRNFSEGGRFGNDNPYGGGSIKWQRSMRAEQQGGQTLVDTSTLKKSVQVDVKQVGTGVEIVLGSNLSYAAVHQFGFDGDMNIDAHIRKIKSRNIRKNIKQGKLGAKGIAFVKQHSRNVNIPARPFLVLQDEDIQDIIDIMTAHLISSFGKNP